MSRPDSSSDKLPTPPCYVTREEADRQVAFAKNFSSFSATTTTDSKVRTTLGTIGLVLMLTGTAVYAWSTIKRDVTDIERTQISQAQKIIEIELQARADREILIEIRADQRIMMKLLEPKLANQ